MELPPFERKPASRTSTGRTNRDSAAAAASIVAPNAAKRVRSGDVNFKGTETSEQTKSSRSRRPPAQEREGTAEMRDRVATNLKDDFDR